MNRGRGTVGEDWQESKERKKLRAKKVIGSREGNLGGDGGRNKERYGLGDYITWINKGDCQS